ncbi:hypothetical protein ATY30_28855 [Sinorhizobium americanum]|nr:hypothetical protein ATY30_28855 [Sinorhizobium americanum]
MPLSQFQHAISAHLISAFNVIRVAAHHLKAVDAEADGERGVIVNIASISAFEGRARQVAHAASSGAIVSLTTQLAREFAPFGIRVVGIAPGVFEGDGPNSALADRGNSKFVPVLPNRIGRPEELAGLVVAVAGQVYINGVTIRQDGGLRMPPQV